ncbi:hypothetical protein [Maritimibacter sp. DP1N21-5]|uniref:hypothetical protein n=1 Tax=Maritimibacter sp. DP1N21-5 TaxID=2836867 RepID=UPI001C487BEB|nr:hypothetical protein [Maritimibacter sp. DP1N21-5]MBV7407548.1 hypothetical protein [Maritimibacter sp. DP1N21-5]
MTSRIDIASRAGRKAQPTTPPTAAEEAAKPVDERPSRAARIFALMLLPFVYFANTLFSDAKDASAIEVDKQESDTGEDDAAAAGPAPSGDQLAAVDPLRLDGINAEKDKSDMDGGGRDFSTSIHASNGRQGSDRLDDLISRALGEGNTWPDPMGPLSGPDLAAFTGTNSTGAAPVNRGGGANAAPGQTGENGEGQTEQPGENAGPDGPAPAQPGGDAIARLFEDMGHWFGDLPDETVGRVTDLVVGDLMQHLPMEEILRQSGLVDDPSGLPFLSQVIVLRDPSARDAFADRMGFGQNAAPAEAAMTVEPVDPADLHSTDLG